VNKDIQKTTYFDDDDDDYDRVYFRMYLQW